MEKYSIKDDIWPKLFEFFQFYNGVYARDEKKVRLFVEAVFWILRTGAQWRELPQQYGKWPSVHKRFMAWDQKGVWAKLLSHVSRDYDGESVMLDGSIVRAHACASGWVKGGNESQALGRSKGGFTTKIHALVDALGQALRFILTPGHRHESTQAIALIEGIERANIIGDKAFDSDALISKIQQQKCTPVIPSRKNRLKKRFYDKHLYRERHLIELFFGKLKHFRRIFSRFDKKASTYTAFLSLASTLLWLR